VSARVALAGIHYLLRPPKIISKTCEFSGMEVEVVYHFVLVDDTDLRVIRKRCRETTVRRTTQSAVDINRLARVYELLVTETLILGANI